MSRFGVVSAAVTVGIVAGAVGVIIYDMVHLVLGLYDDD